MANIKVKNLAVTNTVTLDNKLMVLTDDANNVVKNVEVSNLAKSLISSDANNNISLGTDDKFYAKGLEPATATKLGGVKVGDNLFITQLGRLNSYKLLGGDGISIVESSTLYTDTEVTTSDPNITVTSSYTGTQAQEGTITYEFNYVNKYSGSSEDKTGHCDHFILNGELYYANNGSNTKIGTSDKWSALSNTNSEKTLAINDGDLYLLNTTTATLLDSSGDWLKVCGYYIANFYSYAIKNDGTLYAISIVNNEINIEQVSNSTKWTNICGYSTDIDFAYGLNDGALYGIQGTTATKIGSSTSWTNITGHSTETTAFAYAIDNGSLYALNGLTTTQVGSSTSWTDISGYSIASSIYGFGINNGNLYYLSGTTATQLDQYSYTGSWTNVSGQDNGAPASYGLGIRSGIAYKINHSGISTIGGGNLSADSVFGNTKTIYDYAYFVGGGNLYTVSSSSQSSAGTINTNGWFLNGSAVTLATYDLTVTGTPKDEDTITLIYVTSLIENQRTISGSKATISALGMVKAGSGLNIASDGTLSLDLDVTTLATSGTITLADNTINTITPSDTVTFSLPAITDLTVFHQILVQVELSTVYSITLGTTNFFNKTAPDMSASGIYDLIYEYDNTNQIWVVGCIEKGAAS